MFPEEKLGSEFLFSLSTHKIYLGYLFFFNHSVNQKTMSTTTKTVDKM